MTMRYETPTASQALPLILSDLLEYGDEVGSRNGRVKELLNTQIVLTDPARREVLSIGRKANVFAQIAETMWVLAGRNDIEWLSAYLPRAEDYSDDGKHWRGGYGPRIRGGHFGFDQLEHVIDILREDPLSRRAVIAIYDPTTDASPGKDIPCNDFLQFQNRGGALYLTVTVRSNDAMWGWSGINAFEWSTLQEIVASLLGIRVGELVFNIGSLHLYQPHWDKARRIYYENDRATHIAFNPDRTITTLAEVDLLLDRWFVWEEMCRAGLATLDLLGDWEEPLFKTWAAAIAYYWQRDDHWREWLDTAALAVAIGRSPASVLPEPVQKPFGGPVAVGPATTLSEPARAFYEFVADLHAEKHQSYGDSWKKRGEKMSILANIARKVDRLGVGDSFDSSADTVIDLMVYLAKYLCWLEGEDAVPANVNMLIAQALNGSQSMPEPNWATGIPRDFNWYADHIDELNLFEKCRWVESLLDRVTPIARVLWQSEQDEYKGADFA